MTKKIIKRQIGQATLYCADCNEVLPTLESLDACVTDPPYGLSFMGNQWDYEVPGVDVWTKVNEVLKPGAHLLSFFGSRTYHRGAIPIEDAGFEIRDQLMWLYGSGFPKSYNIGKAVDKLQGNEREDLGANANQRLNKPKHDIYEGGWHGKEARITKGNSEWEGWGTALKPAHEPIVMARKPFKETVTENVLEHGTGGINIDECRVETDDEPRISNTTKSDATQTVYGKGWQKSGSTPSEGRFPANVMHDGSDEVMEIFPQTSKSVSTKRNRITLGSFGMPNDATPEYDDEGTAARYFYCAKANKKDRDEGLDEFVEKQRHAFQTGNGASGKPSNISAGRNTAYRNTHPTVKPTELMRYLCRLVTPKGGIVLDPFMGSGSTGKAAVKSGFKFVGIEMNEEYFEIACARIEAAQNKIQKELFDE